MSSELDGGSKTVPRSRPRSGPARRAALGAGLGVALGLADVARGVALDGQPPDALEALLVLSLWTAVAGFVAALLPLRSRSSAVLPVAALLALAGAAPPSEPPTAPDAERRRPNLLLVLVDTLRADALSAYGYPRPTSPRLDALAASGTLYERAVSQSSYTRPAVASIMTSRLPSQHGFGGSFHDRLSEAAATLPEILRDAGYETVGWSTNPWVSRTFGLVQGFDGFELLDDVGAYRTSIALAAWRRAERALASLTGRNGLLRYRSVRRRVQGVVGNSAKDRVLVNRFVAWLDRGPRARPFFAYLHLMSPHIPYDPPRDARAQIGAPQSVVVDEEPAKAPCYTTAAPIPVAELALRRALYDACVAAADALVGEVLDAIGARGLARNTLVVVTADHGEEFYEHGNWAHGQSLYQELIHVPLLVRWPGVVAAGRRVDRPVMTVDILPTMLAAAGVAPPADAAGTNLLDAAAPRPRPIYAELPGDDCTSRSAMDDARKLLEWDRRIAPVAAGRLAFDLLADPRESRPLPAEDAAFARLRDALGMLVGDLGPSPAPAERARIDPEQEERLRALGYVR